jgi:hypothetical protein
VQTSCMRHERADWVAVAIKITAWNQSVHDPLALNHALGVLAAVGCVFPKGDFPLRVPFRRARQRPVSTRARSLP